MTKEINKTRKGVLGEFSGKSCDVNVMNANDMHLGREVFEVLMASDEYKRAMKNRHYIGYLGHPQETDHQDYEHACIVLTDMRLESNGDVFARFDLVDTPVGRIVKSFIDAGVKFGISIRGAGDVASDGEVDPEGFIFRGFDLVTFPAYEDCIPEFREIAASTDISKQAKFKKICASINDNLKQITSCTTLETIQAQFPEGCDEFNTIQDRIDELSADPIVDSVADDDPELVFIQDVKDQKISALTNLYVDAMTKIHDLEQQLATISSDKQALIIECSALNNKNKHLKRIASQQVTAANNEVDEADRKLERVSGSLKRTRTELQSAQQALASKTEKFSNAIRANAKLQAKLSALEQEKEGTLDDIKASKDLNLKYERKIEANSKAISQKDLEIEDLKNKLSETVARANTLESEASNLDDKNEELLSRVEAAEDMLSTYQEAYANMYANALGIYVKGLPITASTSVKELREMISAGTNTANIPAAPSYYSESEDMDDESEYVEINESEYVDDEEIDGNYSAGLVSM